MDGLTNDKLREALPSKEIMEAAIAFNEQWLLEQQAAINDKMYIDGRVGEDWLNEVKYCRVLVAVARAVLAAPVEAEPVAQAFVDAKDGSWPEDFSHENGNYSCQCVHCGRVFIGHKRRVSCKVCAHPAEQGKDAEDAATEARAENREPVIVDSVHSAGAYFDWGQSGCGFGQMSFSYKEGAWEFDTEGMGPRWTRKCLHAFADHAADQFEQQHSAARNAKPAKGTT